MRKLFLTTPSAAGMQELMGILEPMCLGEEVLEIGESQEEQEERAGIYKLHVEAKAVLVSSDDTGMDSDDPPPSNNPSGPNGKIVLSGPAHGALNDRMVMSGQSNGTDVADTYDYLGHFLAN